MTLEIIKRGSDILIWEGKESFCSGPSLFFKVNYDLALVNY